MLSEEERLEIEAEFPKYPDKRAASIDALKIVQRRRGWVPDEAIYDLAGLLEMTPDELDSVATFYNLIFRKPVGKHVILLCNSVSCWIMGYDSVRDSFEQRLGVDLGQTSQDGQFTLLPIVCLGACDHAPTLMVDHELIEDFDLEKIDELLERYSIHLPGNSPAIDSQDGETWNSH